MGAAQTLSRAVGQLGDSPQDWTEPAFKKIFLEHYPRIVGVLVRLLGDCARAEEVASDVFLKLYRQAATLQDGNVGGWLYRTATNLGIDRLRASARRKQYEQAAGRLLNDVVHSGPLEDVLRQEKCDRVRTVLASIKSLQAQVLILRASGLSYQELGEALAVKPGNIGTMLIRAEEEFRARYLELYPREEES